jgi:5-methylcytosine-specific restriction endonuclease McrA
MRSVRPLLRAAILRGDLPAWLRRHKRRDRVILSVLSVPPWIRRQDFADLERERDFKTASTGVPHVLDHVIPLDHPLVCGLTVPWNIQIIDAPANSRKGNKLHPAFQSRLFIEPQQLGML